MMERMQNTPNHRATPQPIRLVVLASGNGSNLQAILDNIAGGMLRAKVAAVLSDRVDAFALTRAKRAGVTAEAVPRGSDFFTRLQTRVEWFGPDLIVLAGFMRILPPNFVARFAQRIVNIHPALLPKYKGLNTHQRALDANETEHGATVHLVTEELDAGAILAQARVAVLPDDDAAALAARVLAQEHVIFSRAIAQFAAQHGFAKSGFAESGSAKSPRATPALATRLEKC